MANRFYLYSINTEPEKIINHSEIKGISEWSYDLPLIYKILLKSTPIKCKSKIWDSDENIAIYNNYDAGLSNLKLLFNKYHSNHPLVKEAFAFLSDKKNKGEYFFLEAGEIFEMVDEPFEEQCEKLKQEIENVTIELPDNLLCAEPDIDDMYKIGLGNWSEHLYWSF